MKKKSTAKKVLLTILGVLLALVIVLVGTVYAVWHDEITTLLSFQQVTQRDESHKDGSVYVLNVSGGYHFDEFAARPMTRSLSPLSRTASPRASSP